MYPARNAHAPYCHLWSVRLYNIFPHYLINVTVFKGGKKLLNAILYVCFDFLYSFGSNISYYNKNWATYGQKCILVFV